MIVVVPAPNDDDAPDAMVDDDAVAVLTSASAMSRDTALLSSADPSSSPWPYSRIFPPQGGSSLPWPSAPFIVVVVIIVTLHCDLI